MIDASHCKIHPHAAGAVGGNQDMSRTKGGSIPKFTLPWMRMVCQSEYSSWLQRSCTPNWWAFCRFLLADKGYDTLSINYRWNSPSLTMRTPAAWRLLFRPNAIVKNSACMTSISNKLRHLVENAFLHLKRWRGIATRYAKNSASFLVCCFDLIRVDTIKYSLYILINLFQKTVN